VQSIGYTSSLFGVDFICLKLTKKYIGNEIEIFYEVVELVYSGSGIVKVSIAYIFW
jgi:hypothetical protein